ncbi:MAG: ATP-dependent Clp protease ATP-binding subunit [Thermoflexus sp.]|jgi:ATP-dependent Clp protease ATP-binding subunit ClpC|nr:ATP-dependent Clp protease ATP-binding subunit [Thermoflexus sp.]
MKNRNPEARWSHILKARQEALLQGEEGWERGIQEFAPDMELLEKSPEERVPRLARLDYLGLDLVREIREVGPPRPLLLRMELLGRLIALLTEGHPVALIGEPGVGKKGLLWQLAYAMAHAPDGFPSALSGRPLILTHAPVFHRGVFYMHELENRVGEILRNALQAQAILAVDQVHLLARAGSHELNVERTVANLLLPGLEQGLRFIGLTTPEGFHYLRQQAPHFARALVPFEVPPMEAEEVRTVLEALCRVWRAQGLAVEKGLADAALAAPFQREAAPGGPIRLLRTARAMRKASGRLTREDLAQALAAHTGLPLALVSESHPLSFEEVYAFFAQRIYGQEEAVAAMVDAILTLKARLARPEGPWGVFLFLGPSGVGKTELARQTARFLFGSEDRLIRCDMGAYVGPEGLARFLGDPSGLRHSPVEAVAAHPFCVLLLDEIEKSDRYLFDALLSILGEGRIASARGEVVSFRHCLILMTSNVGSEQYLHLGNPPGLMPVQAASGMETRIRRQLERHFRPEFLNRIDRVIVFRPLTTEGVRRIAEREIQALRDRLAEVRPGLSLEVSPAILERCVAEGYDPALGARPMQRTVARYVQTPLARLLAAHPHLSRGRIRIELSSEGLPQARLESAL